jgi:hypothetical protein
MRNGLVSFTNELGMLVYHTNLDAWKVDRYKVVPIEECNAWHCSYAVGSMDAILRYIASLEPKMEYIIFERTKNNKQPTIVKTERFIQYGRKS